MTGVGELLDRRRLIVCVGTGGVGKTTISAAIALGAAMRGRRAIVLTIDPAKALARALGLASLGPEPEAVPAAGLPLTGRLDAAMLDQQHAWDAFVARHAPTEAAARALYANRFYQQLSSTFAGSTEYIAVEEMCRLAETGRYDLIVLDTPPASHALDFLRAPDRLDRLLDPAVASLWTVPVAAATGIARFVARRLEGAVGGRAVGEIAAFFTALEVFGARLATRTRDARALLGGRDAGLVLVATPRQLGYADTDALAARLRALATPLVAVVRNRVHAPPRGDPAPALAAIADPAAAAWLRAAWDDAAGEAASEAGVAARLAAALPGVAHAAVAEAEHDVHALGDLAAIADALWSGAPAAELA